MPNIKAELECMKHALCKEFLTGQRQLGEQMKNLAFPARVSGMGLINPAMEARIQYTTCLKVTSPQVKLILSQSIIYPLETAREFADIKKEIGHQKERELASLEASLSDSLSNTLK